MSFIMNSFVYQHSISLKYSADFCLIEAFLIEDIYGKVDKISA